MRILCTLLLAGLCLTGLKAATPEGDPAFVGLWQQVEQSRQDGRTLLLPVWKMIQSDGRFCTFLIGNRSGQSVITNEGRYEVTSDSTVTEHVSGSITDLDIVGKSIRLTYRLEGRDRLHLTYRIPGASRDGHETWKRVCLEVPRSDR